MRWLLLAAAALLAAAIALTEEYKAAVFEGSL